MNFPLSPLRRERQRPFVSLACSLALLVALSAALTGADQDKSDPSPAPPRPAEAPPADLTQQIEQGRTDYAASCVACHQTTGEGLPGVFPPLAGSDWVSGSDDRLIRLVLHGLTGPITVNGVVYQTAAMPAFGPGGAFAWSDDRIAAVLTYIRQEWGNQAAPVSPQKVTTIREETGSRAEWTEPELAPFR